MLKFQPGAREYLAQIRALSADDAGKEVFAGMTVEESIWYQDYARDSFHGNVNRADGSQEKYLELQDRHELARRRLIDAEPPARAQSSFLE